MNPGDTCTPIFGLPYPTGTSGPCNVGSTLCAFADAVEAQLDSFDATIARTASTVPMAKVVATVPVLLTSASTSFNAVFDTVEVDTDNMFSGTNPEDIVFNHAGIYLFQGNYFATSTGTSGATLSLSVTLPTFNFGPSNSLVTGLGLFSSAIGMYPVSTSDHAFMRMGVLLAPTDTVTITRIEMMATWLGDLA